MLLRLARDHGWEPSGALAFDRDGVLMARDHWYGLTYDDQIAYRSIEGGDVRRMAAAIDRGARAVASRSDEALMRGGDGGAVEPIADRPTALEYFVEQGLAADWLEQLSDDLVDTATLLVHGDLRGEWESVLRRHVGGEDRAEF